MDFEREVKWRYHIYFDNWRASIQVVACDREGNLLWKRFFNSKGGSSVYLSYNDSGLNIFIPRSDTLYVLDRDGKTVSSVVNPNHADELRSECWTGWDQKGKNYKYYYNNFGVVYEYSSTLLPRKCVLYLESIDNGKVIIYESD